ncbi:uncharacterized protein [Cherax quadricarinatus]|uniref:uncharacterized protein n=1 Tax=Cherax quadricarinatus TaxID=27406 RepID=UPI002379D2C0|nr:uncharacterized protein LOC128700610 [Cherax quadricarinatus]
METVRASITTAEKERLKREDHLKVLLSKTQARGLVLHSPVPYDGDCLFHSVLRLVPSSPPAAGLLRDSLVRFFTSQRCSRELRATADGSFLMELSQQHRDVSDDRVVKGLAEHLSVAINVISLDPSNNNESQLSYYPGERQPSLTIYIGHIKDEHYVPLRVQAIGEKKKQQQHHQQRPLHQQKQLKRYFSGRTERPLKRRALRIPFSHIHYVACPEPL